MERICYKRAQSFPLRIAPISNATEGDFLSRFSLVCIKIIPVWLRPVIMVIELSLEFTFVSDWNRQYTKRKAIRS